MVTGKKTVSERAVIARINRALAKDGEALRKTRNDSRWLNDLGHYYIIDANLNTITAQHISLSELGRELNVLKPWEVVEGEADAPEASEPLE